MGFDLKGRDQKCIFTYNLPKNKTKIRPKFTYPKKLDSEARLWNEKVLGTHSAQIESGLLDSCDLCTSFMHEMNDILYMTKIKSHKLIYECILFFVLKKSDLLLWVKKLILVCKKSDMFDLIKTKSLGFFKKFRSVFKI